MRRLLMLCLGLLLLGHPALAQQRGQSLPNSTAPQFQQAYPILPLPFNPERLTGISRAQVQAWHNSYADTVRFLNGQERARKALALDTPVARRRQVEQEWLAAYNKRLLHEIAFSHMGGDGLPRGAIELMLAARFGGLANWQTRWKELATTLNSGTCWVVMEYNLLTRQLELVALPGSSAATVGGIPLLAMDMHAYAYDRDFGVDRAIYVNTWLTNLDWEAINRRLNGLGVKL
jgi:Fe-Mn family superoxide dismutase